MERCLVSVAQEVDGVVAQFKGEAAVEQEVVAHFEGGFEAGVFFGLSPCHHWEEGVGGASFSSMPIQLKRVRSHCTSRAINRDFRRRRCVCTVDLHRRHRGPR